MLFSFLIDSFGGWALEEESEEVSSAEPEGEPEVLEEETFEDWGDSAGGSQL